MLLALLLICGILAYCMTRHFAHTKEFNPLWFDLDAEVREAEKRAVKPCIAPKPIPFAHKAMYLVDLAICLAAAGGIVWLILNAI